MGVLGHVEKAEFHGGVFGLVAGNQFVLAFQEIEGRAVRLRRDGDKKDQESQGLLHGEPEAFLGPHDVHQAHGTGENDDGRHGQGQGNLVTDHLGGGPQSPRRENLLLDDHPARRTP